MSPSTEVLFQQLYNTENSVLVSALRGDMSDLQGSVKQLKSLWKQISWAKDKQLDLEVRKSFSNEALQILSGKLSDVKAIEELKEKAGAYFKESQARKEAQEVNKGQAAEGVAGPSLEIFKWISAIKPPMVAADPVLPAGLVSTAAQLSLVDPSSKPGRALVSSPLSLVELVPARLWLIRKASKAQIPQQEWRKYTAQTLPHSPPPSSQSKHQFLASDKDNKNDLNDNNDHFNDKEHWQEEITPSMRLEKYLMTAPPCAGACLDPPCQYCQKKGLQCVKTKGGTLFSACQLVLKKTCSLTRYHKEEVWRNKGKKGKKEKRQRKPKSAEYVKEPASNLLPPIQPAPSTRSLPPVPASTLAPIAEAEELNNDKAAQPKDKSEINHATIVVTTVDQSTIADNSALISNPIAIVTNSGILSGSATKSIEATRPTASVTSSAIATNSVTPTGLTATITDSTIATGPAASNVDMTGLAPADAPDEIVPQHDPSTS
ncbi:hypothetical protein E4T56_gene1511 [Termitomyces sp. T112]|nr:hypothetical protein E4T56_gene1511 [Termitomyces sp. T112]